MNKILKPLGTLICAAALVALTACGGGGGSAGGSSGGGGGGTTTSSPSLSLSVVNSSAAALTAPISIDFGTPYFAQAKVLTAAGSPAVGVIVTFATDTTVASLSNSLALTDATGTAKVQITPVRLSTTGVAILTASATVSGVDVGASANYQTTPANVVVSALTATPNSLTALQTAAVSANVLINGVLAGAGQASVAFTASCGSFSPASATTGAGGVVQSVYQPNGCSGTVTISATSSTSSTTTSVTVAAPVAANVQFVSAIPAKIFIKTSVGGTKTSTIKFKVVDAAGNAIQSEPVLLSLDAQSIGAGVQFSLGTGSASTAPQTVNTDASGIAQVIVQSGTVPTPVIVSASLPNYPSVPTTSSSNITVTSGKPSQNRSSISATKLSIEAFGVDGVKTDITFRVSDRQGNEVPVGTVVNFVSSHSTINGSCVIDASSSCTVTLTSSGSRPAPGDWAAVLAFMEGEESFVDLNSNNVWDPGEPFTDMGEAYRDDNRDDIADPTEPKYLLGGTPGTNPCPATGIYPSVANTCDGKWSSSIRVRQIIFIAHATSNATITLLPGRTVDDFHVLISDVNDVAMPTGTTVSAAVTKPPGTACAVVSTSPNVVRNSPDPGTHKITLNGDPTCASATVDVIVTSPAGFITRESFP